MVNPPWWQPLLHKTSPTTNSTTPPAHVGHRIETCAAKRDVSELEGDVMVLTLGARRTGRATGSFVLWGGQASVLHQILTPDEHASPFATEGKKMPTEAKPRQGHQLES